MCPVASHSCLVQHFVFCAHILPHSFLGILSVFDPLPESCCIVHLDQYCVACISFVHCFFSGVHLQAGKSMIILLLHDSPSELFFTSFTTRSFDWNVFSGVVRCIKHPRGYLRSWKMRELGTGVTICSSDTLQRLMQRFFLYRWLYWWGGVGSCV